MNKDLIEILNSIEELKTNDNFQEILDLKEKIIYLDVDRNFERKRANFYENKFFEEKGGIEWLKSIETIYWQISKN